MHTVDMLKEAIRIARHCGYEIRQEWLGGCGSGGCVLKGKKWIFVDLAAGPSDQLDQVLDVLRHEPEATTLPMPHQLRSLLKVRKSA